MDGMQSQKDVSRLFFGAEVEAPWPTELPPGRIIQEENRHLTFAFLGNCSLSALKNHLSSLPMPHFSITPIGRCDRLLLLPEKEPRVVSYHVLWMTKQVELDFFQRGLKSWLKEKGYPVDSRDSLSHITLAREPFDEKEWKEAFFPLPLMLKKIHLYESVGNLCYTPVWTHALSLAFEELDHTADIAFCIRGEDLFQLHLHAHIALSFKFPPFLSYWTPTSPQSLSLLVRDLNRSIALADQQEGCPFKAVSLHGDIMETAQNRLEWEMIVDV